ncbi:MAG: nitroreductase family protein [Oscillospiraceae bacterium]|nr:nitroreductase family protein [Oscillospiraceae bacterium]
MTIIEAIQQRHSVRRYTDQSIENDTLSALQAEVDKCNTESGLNIRLVANDPDTFNGLLAKVRFSGAKNYIVLAGKESADLEEKAGYYGERIVIKAQQLGLNTCWAAMFNGKKYAAKIGKDEKIVIIIALGYGVTQGVPHKSKPLESLCRVDGDMPSWFRSGMEAAMLAPTAMNQQKFLFTLSGGTVKAESTGGSFSKIDLGIAKYHFEVGAGIENFKWK